jgi:aryl-phospho-beta-D-glucosidase BglC (GH1 family)
MKKKSNYSMCLCNINFRNLFRSIKLNLVLTLLLIFSAFVTISANTAFTGMRNITSLQLTADMGAGWNLGNSLDAHGSWVSGLETETCWGNPKTTKAMIDAVKQKGFKTIRVPVTWYQHLGGAPNYTIDAAWLDRVEEVINYAFANDMYVIINIHHDDSWVVPTYAQKDATINQISKVWTQIANRFKNYGDYLIFETLNEPRLVGSAEEWTGGTPEGRDVLNAFHLAAVNAIRNTGGNNASRHLMVSPYGANGGSDAINDLVIPNNDSRVIISWHNYSPYNFVLQIPGTTTWGSSSEQSALLGEFDRLYNKFIQNGRAVVIGEWSPTDKNNTTERAKYAEFFIQAAKARKMATIWWDNGDINGGDSDGGSAIFNRNTVSWLYPTIADAIVNNSGTCTPTSITSYLQVNDGSWQQTSSVTVNSGDKVKFGPQPTSGGSWSWSGGGTSGTSREQTIYPTSSVTATATYTNTCGAQSAQNFTVNVNGGVGTTVHLTKRNASGFALDGGNGDASGGQLYLWSSDINNVNQAWVEIDRGNGYYSYQKLNTDYCIDGGNGGENGQAVILWPCDANNENQHWQKIDAGNSNYRLQKRNSPGYSIDGNNGGANEQSVYLWASDANNENQQWTFSSSSLKSAIIATEEESISLTEKILAYPNPVTDVLNLQLSVPVNEIAIFSIEGKLLYRQNSTSEKVEIDMSDYKPEIYFVKAIGQNETWTQKILKK